MPRVPQPARRIAVIATVGSLGVALLLLLTRLRPTTLADVTHQDVTFANRTFTICEIDLTRARLHLHWKRPDGTRYANFARLPGSPPVAFATNAGIFDPTFTPCGLHVEGGHELIPLNLNDGAGNFYLKPNGVFLIDDTLGARVIESTQYAGTTPATHLATHLATQSGPLLVIDGSIHPQFARASANRRIRSGVGVRSRDRVVFAISREPVTFHEFATLFQSHLGCPNALYLDGEISRFHVPAKSNSNDGDFAGILTATRR